MAKMTLKDEIETKMKLIHQANISRGNGATLVRLINDYDKVLFWDNYAAWLADNLQSESAAYCYFRDAVNSYFYISV